MKHRFLMKRACVEGLPVCSERGMMGVVGVHILRCFRPTKASHQEIHPDSVSLFSLKQKSEKFCFNSTSELQLLVVFSAAQPGEHHCKKILRKSCKGQTVTQGSKWGLRRFGFKSIWQLVFLWNLATVAIAPSYNIMLVIQQHFCRRGRSACFSTSSEDMRMWGLWKDERIWGTTMQTLQKLRVKVSNCDNKFSIICF